MILGVDGGGTKTKVVVIDKDGNIIYKGIGGPGNHLVVGVEGVAKSIAQGLGDYKNYTFDIAIIGMGGAGFEPTVRKRLANEIKKVINAKTIEVYNDCYVALIGAIGKRESGMIILSGTGSMVIGIDKEGKYHKAGGWGHILGDEGSGYRISYDAIRAVMSYWEDMGPHTILVDALSAHFGFSSFQDVIDFFYIKGGDRKKVASFSPSVARAAEEGDFIANKILRYNIKSLIRGVGSVKTKIKDDYVSYGGGMFNSKYYKTIAREELQIMGFELKNPVLSPIGGALFMGFSRLGILSDNIFNKLKSVK